MLARRQHHPVSSSPQCVWDSRNGRVVGVGEPSPRDGQDDDDTIRARAQLRFHGKKCQISVTGTGRNRFRTAAFFLRHDHQRRKTYPSCRAPCSMIRPAVVFTGSAQQQDTGTSLGRKTTSFLSATVQRTSPSESNQPDRGRQVTDSRGQKEGLCTTHAV